MRSEIGLLVRVSNSIEDNYIVFDGEFGTGRFRFADSCDFDNDTFLLGEAYRLILDDEKKITEVQPLFELLDLEALQKEIDMKATLRPRTQASGATPNAEEKTPALLKPANSLNEKQANQEPFSASMTILCTAMNVAAVLVTSSKSFDIKDPDSKNEFFSLARELDSFMTRRLSL